MEWVFGFSGFVVVFVSRAAVITRSALAGTAMKFNIVEIIVFPQHCLFGGSMILFVDFIVQWSGVDPTGLQFLAGREMNVFLGIVHFIVSCIFIVSTVKG